MLNADKHLLRNERLMLGILQAHPVWMTRSDIAHVLQRSSLHIGQVTGLNRLAASGLIEVRSTPARGHGWRYEYRAMMPVADSFADRT